MSIVLRSRGPGLAQGLSLASVLVHIQGSSWGPAWGGALTNHLQALFGVLGVDVVQLLLEFHDLLCLNGDVCSLALGEHPKREKVAASVSHSRGGWRWVLGAPSWDGPFLWVNEAQTQKIRNYI